MNEFRPELAHLVNFRESMSQSSELSQRMRWYPLWRLAFSMADLPQGEWYAYPFTYTTNEFPHLVFFNRGVSYGFRISTELAQQIKHFSESDPNEIFKYPAIVQRFTQLGLLRKQMPPIVNHSGELRNKGYVFVRDLLDTLQVAQYAMIAKQLHLQMQHGDTQCPTRMILHNPEPFKVLHQGLTGLLSLLAGESVKPSYAYLANYLPNSELHRHTDREQCRWNVSVMIDQRPWRSRQNCWPIYVQPGDEPIKIEQCIGDAIIYSGTDVPHWRPKMTGHEYTTVIFLHYVNADFQGSLQ